MKRSVVLSGLGGLILATQAQAAPVAPLSYDTVNGNSGSFNYWDQNYTGAGCTTCDNAPLTGGLGDLTDGVIPTDNWFIVEAPPGNGPYVGWQLDPTITFRFAPATAIGAVTIHFDDSNGAGGVSAPGSFDINGVSYAVPEPAGSAPSFITVSGLGFVGDTFVVTAHRKNTWVFLSEFAFDGAGGGTVVPEPASWALMLAGFGALGVTARVRKRRIRASAFA